LIQDSPNVLYLQADAKDPHNVLDAPETRKLLGNERRVGFVFHNLAHAMSDDQVKKAWSKMYDWCSPGSLIAAMVASEHWNYEPDLLAVLQVYQSAQMTGFFRTTAQLRELALPWSVTGEGVLPNTEWKIPRAQALARVTAYSLVAAKSS
jgi:hypothetical protein